ncbi:homeobox protein Hox-B1-like [Cylas formicarius]|uniref:homeobox protein Hox-B1-like n=1 Tax=Cylas formicarius TaxID=197179 RepID=UPI002958D458|nr:homeobox protein Hox-B1-like [Cylas formicarius]
MMCNLKRHLRTECGKEKKHSCSFCGMRRRQNYTPNQISLLEKEFQENAYLDSFRRAAISRKLGLSQKQIKIWFQNRRMKEKHSKRLNEADHNTNSSSSQPEGPLNLSNSATSSSQSVKPELLPADITSQMQALIANLAHPSLINPLNHLPHNFP